MQKVKLININPLHAANVAGLLYILMGVLYALGFFFLAPFDPQMDGTSTKVIGIISLAMLVAMPLLGWIAVFIGTWFGNIFLKMAGGIEVTFKNK